MAVTGVPVKLDEQIAMMRQLMERSRTVEFTRLTNLEDYTFRSIKRLMRQQKREEKQEQEQPGRKGLESEHRYFTREEWQLCSSVDTVRARQLQLSKKKSRACTSPPPPIQPESLATSQMERLDSEEHFERPPDQDCKFLPVASLVK